MTIGVLAYPRCFASEVFGVPDLLTMAAHVARAAGCAGSPDEVVVMAARRSVVGAGGMQIAVARLRPVDVLVVPGFELSFATDLDALLAGMRPELAAIRAHRAAGGVVVTICVGAFLAAAAGVLDGHRATTSWLFADVLARRYPAVEVDAVELTVSDGGVITAAAFSAMYDLALLLIARRNGADVARRTARIALVDDARTSQLPYVDGDLLPDVAPGFGAAVGRWLDRHLDDPYDLSALAARFHVSTRTLLRRFRADTGTTPLRHLQAARMQRACRLLESSELAVGAIATEVGYGDAGTFTKIFRREVGRTPSDYRATFRRGTLV